MELQIKKQRREFRILTRAFSRKSSSDCFSVAMMSERLVFTPPPPKFKEQEDKKKKKESAIENFFSQSIFTFPSLVSIVIRSLILAIE